MTDIVERLRLCYLGCTYRRAMEAADEIERLRAALRAIVTAPDGFENTMRQVAREALGGE